MLSFQREVSERLRPYIQRSKGNIDHINREIEHVAWLITNAAQKTLPLLKPKKAHRFRDRTLSQLCVESKKAWRVWCKEGRPPTGPLYDAKCSLRRKVRQRIKFVLPWKRGSKYKDVRTSSAPTHISVSPTEA